MLSELCLSPNHDNEHLLLDSVSQKDMDSFLHKIHDSASVPKQIQARNVESFCLQTKAVNFVQIA